jgi:hypothetical protein
VEQGVPAGPGGDKYRAFFETTVLATDTANYDKRLVGYALLQEFVTDSSTAARRC